MNYTSYNDLSKDIKNNLHLVRHKHFELIVGIPRSGMIPAYMIALGLNIQCTTLQSFLSNEPLTHGITRRTNTKLAKPWEAKNVLFVDDSISSGKSLTLIMESLPDHLKEKVTTSVIYSSKPVRKEVDIIFKSRSNPRIFEWNFFHHPYLENMCVNMDELFYALPTESQKKDEESWNTYITNTPANVLPSYKMHSLITGRPEKYRRQTEEWLSKNNIEYGSLIMKDSNSNDNDINWIAEYFKNSSAQYFIEKNKINAYKICKYAVKSVFCIDDNKFFKPSKLEYITKDPYYIPYQIKLMINNLKPYFSK